MNRPPEFPDADLQERLRDFIEETWQTLTRDPAHILAALEDTKIEAADGPGRSKLYVSPREDLAAVSEKIRSKIGDRRFAQLDVLVLPHEHASITDHGLLYLPGEYVVPGGRFNEFYGWDSYFIQRGLMRGGKIDLAASMVEQALYEVNHYGMVLNANRTYYLSRSHPPVLSMMIRDIAEVRPDRDWLAGAMPLLEKFYYYWRVPPHLNQATGLSRYHDMGSGPAPEVEFSERDEAGLSHYERVKEFLRTSEVQSYDKSLYYDEASDSLTPLAFKGDRSMRESGFDPTDRFGPLNLDVIHYVPVCLNVLLYQMEKDIAAFHRTLDDPRGSEVWEARASETADSINNYFWNEDAGLYFDYHLGDGKQREYPFLTTFWPLWAGVASQDQARKVAANLNIFLADGGLRTSSRVTGEQWDAPFAWAPLQLFAVDGLERYGYHSEAREIARRFTAMVAAEFSTEGVLREKYDAERCSAGVEDQIHFGYSSNEIGFGWTNAVILEFLDRYR